MISFRYHLVTIVAVFLALGLGVLMGTTVVKQSVIEQLQSQVNRQSNAASQLRKRVNEQSAQLHRWDSFSVLVQKLLVEGQLQDRTVVVVTTESVDIAELNGVRQALLDAGAQVAGVLLASARMALTDQSARADMADVLGLAPTLPAGDLTQQAAARLGTRLAEGPGLDPTTDILRSLRAARFLQAQSDQGGLEGIGGSDQGFVILAGGSVAMVPPATDFFMPLITSLTQASRPVATGEAEQNVDPFVALVRQDGALSARVVTVDDADGMPGRVALILGLRGLFDADLSGCHSFGIKTGACGLLPQPAATPSP